MKRFLALLTLSFLSSFTVVAQSVPPLINYQGRLTDASGTPLPAGVYAVAFRFWDRQSLIAGQTLIWGREYDVTIIEGGAFNVILGAPGGRTLVDNPPPAVNDLGFGFGQSNRFLGLTIARDANGQAVPNPRELVPRQQILTVPFALSAATAASVLPGSITTASLTPGLIQTTNLGDGVVALPKLSPRQIATNSAGVGSVAFSRSSGILSIVPSTTSETTITNLSLNLVTTGRPVLVFLSSVEPAPPVPLPATDSFYGEASLGGYVRGLDFELVLNIYRATTLISRSRFELGFGGGGSSPPLPTLRIPPSCIQLIDSPPAGTNSYSVTVSGIAERTDIYNVRLVALEL